MWLLPGKCSKPNPPLIGAAQRVARVLGEKIRAVKPQPALLCSALLQMAVAGRRKISFTLGGGCQTEESHWGQRDSVLSCFSYDQMLTLFPLIPGDREEGHSNVLHEQWNGRQLSAPKPYLAWSQRHHSKANYDTIIQYWEVKEAGYRAEAHSLGLILPEPEEAWLPLRSSP